MIGHSCTLFCCALLIAFVACQEQKKTNAATPNAVRDLLIDRSFWQSKKTADSSSKPINVHRLTITNTSHQYTYGHIKVRFDYFNSHHQKVDSVQHTIEKILVPRSAISVSDIEKNPTQPDITSATASIVTAQAAEALK